MNPCPRCNRVEKLRDEDGAQLVVYCRCGFIDHSIPDYPPLPTSCIDGGRCEDYPCCGCDGPAMIVLG